MRESIPCVLNLKVFLPARAARLYSKKKVSAMSSEKNGSQKNLATLYNDLESHGISSLNDLQALNKALFLWGGLAWKE